MQTGSRRSLALAAAFVLALVLAPAAAHAAPAWVKGEENVNLRAGPGTQFRIIATLKRDLPVTVIGGQEGWVRVRTPDSKVGWLPARYVQREAPASVRLARAEAERDEARAQLEKLTAEVEALRSENTELTQRVESQEAEIRTLTAENLDLKAGERWPYLATGAIILIAGVLAGVLLARTSSRRPQPRLRF